MLGAKLKKKYHVWTVLTSHILKMEIRRLREFCRTFFILQNTKLSVYSFDQSSIVFDRKALKVAGGQFFAIFLRSFIFLNINQTSELEKFIVT